MSVKAELLDLLVHLPEVETVDKRRALVSLVGFAYIGIYLDWQGNTVVFFSRLVDELSRAGKPTLLKFLQNLPDTPHVGVERATKVKPLADAIQALDEPTWQSEFGTALAEGTREAVPDRDMLAVAVVSTLLRPHFEKPGGKIREVAGRVAERVEQVLATDGSAAKVWGRFKQTPERHEELMLDIVKDKLAEDAGLPQELTDLVLAALRTRDESGPGGIDVVQEINLVQGNVVGAAIGSDVVAAIYASIVQKVDTVGPDGELTGVRIGSL